jgi:hypothetical protein
MVNLVKRRIDRGMVVVGLVVANLTSQSGFPTPDSGDKKF